MVDTRPLSLRAQSDNVHGLIMRARITHHFGGRSSANLGIDGEDESCVSGLTCLEAERRSIEYLCSPLLVSEHRHVLPRQVQ